MVMLGAYVAATGLLKPETIEAMIQAMFTGPKAKLVPLEYRSLPPRHDGHCLIRHPPSVSGAGRQLCRSVPDRLPFSGDSVHFTH